LNILVLHISVLYYLISC